MYKKACRFSWSGIWCPLGKALAFSVWNQWNTWRAAFCFVSRRIYTFSLQAWPCVWSWFRCGQMICGIFRVHSWCCFWPLATLVFPWWRSRSTASPSWTTNHPAGFFPKRDSFVCLPAHSWGFWFHLCIKQSPCCPFTWSVEAFSSSWSFSWRLTPRSIPSIRKAK